MKYKIETEVGASYNVVVAENILEESLLGTFQILCENIPTVELQIRLEDVLRGYPALCKKLAFK